jgi:hypothetical protein
VSVRRSSVVRPDDGVEITDLDVSPVVFEYRSELFHRVAVTNRVLVVESHFESGVVNSGRDAEGRHFF